MIKLRDLLTEGDTIVKNKKTGNVYSVKTFNPAIHNKPTAADIQTTKAKNGGKIPKDPTATPQNLQKLAQLKQQSKLTSLLPKSDSRIKEKTNRDTQIDKLSKEKEAIDKEWDEKYRNLSDAEFEKYDLPLQRKSNAIQKQMDDLEPSTISFGKKTQKAVSDWFDANKIPYELKAGSNSNTPELQFDSKNLPKDKVKELVQLAKYVQKKEKIGIDGDLDSTLYIK